MNKELGVLEEHLLKVVKESYISQLQNVFEKFVIDVNKLHAKYGIKPDGETNKFIQESIKVDFHMQRFCSPSYWELHGKTPQKLDDQLLNKAAKTLIREVTRNESTNN
jgi:hypothetical protein